MQVNDALIDKLANLTKLRFEGEAREQIKGDLNKMLVFVEQINALDTEGVEPLIHLTLETNHLRKDVPAAPISQEDALKNAPKRDSDYIRVPKVVDKSEGA